MGSELEISVGDVRGAATSVRLAAEWVAAAGRDLVDLAQPLIRPVAGPGLRGTVVGVGGEWIGVITDLTLSLHQVATLLDDAVTSYLTVDLTASSLFGG